jgi:hypothetical protein
MRNALLGKQEVLHVIVVDNHGAVAAQKLDAVGLPLRRIARRQRISDAEIDHRAVGERDQRPGHVVGAVTRAAKDAVLAPRHHFNRLVAFE